MTNSEFDKIKYYNIKINKDGNLKIEYSANGIWKFYSIL